MEYIYLLKILLSFIFCPQYFLKAGHHKGINCRDELVSYQLLLLGVDYEGKVEEREDTDPEEGDEEEVHHLPRYQFLHVP